MILWHLSCEPLHKQIAAINGGESIMTSQDLAPTMNLDKCRIIDDSFYSLGVLLHLKLCGKKDETLIFHKFVFICDHRTV